MERMGSLCGPTGCSVLGQWWRRQPVWETTGLWSLPNGSMCWGIRRRPRAPKSQRGVLRNAHECRQIPTPHHDPQRISLLQPRQQPHVLVSLWTNGWVSSPKINCPAHSPFQRPDSEALGLPSRACVPGREMLPGITASNKPHGNWRASWWSLLFHSSASQNSQGGLSRRWFAAVAERGTCGSPKRKRACSGPTESFCVTLMLHLYRTPGTGACALSPLPGPHTDRWHVFNCKEQILF